MQGGFEFKQLTDYEKLLMDIASDKLPKESKKFIKKNATKLSGKQKKQFRKLPFDKVNKNIKKAVQKGFKIGKIRGEGQARAFVLKGMKSGKVYKRGEDVCCRAYASNLANILNDGFTHHGGFTKEQKKRGIEQFIEGFHFMESANKDFESEYYGNAQDFINEITSKL